MKQIIVNVSGLSVEEKQRVNEALAKVTGVRKTPLINNSAGWFFAPASSGSMMVTWGLPSVPETETPTHTPQQVLEMAGMAKQGHVHADLMAQYAEDAKTTDKPWELWQIKVDFTDGHKWVSLKSEFHFKDGCEYRRKPKTKLIHGVEIPDLPLTPFVGCYFYCTNIGAPEFYETRYMGSEGCPYTKRMVERGLIYPYTEEGKQAAILHAKSLLGIA